MAAPRWSYESPLPWEERQGSLVDRVARVNAEARRVYAQQEALLPTLHHDHALDPAVGDHLQDVGRRVQILYENNKKPDKRALVPAHKRGEPKRVIPSRFREDADETDFDGEDEDSAFVQGRIETMLMDQEWDTRAWNAAKIHIAVETLYDQVELSNARKRRELATTMLLRLLETHESAVAFVESTIPILMNKAFRSLAKSVDTTRVFRLCTLLSVLSEWFAPILSRDNAMGKSISFLLRETELCARIVQHHWRGVLFERKLTTRDVDASVRARLRSMHLIKNVELRHQFKVLRDASGPEGLPVEAMRAYVKILFHLVKPTLSAVDTNRHHAAAADQKRLLSSGMMAMLTSLIPSDLARIPSNQLEARRAITEHVKGIALELTQSFSADADKIVSIIKSNIIQRVICDLDQQLHTSTAPPQETLSRVHSSLEVVATITKAVWQLYDSNRSGDQVGSTVAGSTETSFLMRQLRVTAVQFLVTPQVTQSLLRVMPLARQWKDHHTSELVLSTLRYLSGSYGFTALLDALTRNGGRALEQIILCFDDPSPPVMRAAVALFHDVTNHPDARTGFTAVGAVAVLSKWCDAEISASKNQPRFVLALCGIVLLARQHGSLTTSSNAYSGNLFSSLDSLEHQLEALYGLLLELVSCSSRDAAASALYLHQTANVFAPILLKFLIQVQPSDMEPTFQTCKQRSISCIVLGRFFKVPSVAAAAFSEATVTHLTLALQCSRLDELEGKLRPSQSTEHERRLHFLGLKEACKALTRLARCPAGAVDVTLRPSITSGNVPLLPPAIICDVVTRLHVLEDLLPLIHVPTDAAEFVEVDVAMVHAAVELVGYLRPMPYGGSARQRFLAATLMHPHGVFANDRLERLVAVAAPSILHVLKEKNCGKELVEACCSALSRLAATSKCRLLLLYQGAMFVALTHVPEVLYDSQEMKKQFQWTRTGARGNSRSSSPLQIDATVDDRGLLDVPPSLFTLLAKLCLVPDGRMAIMKAQMLPRILKRLQLTDSHRPDRDLDAKSAISGLIQRLAMCNAAEGNTSELFLHFRVVELLAQIVVSHSRSLPPLSEPQSPAKRSHLLSAIPASQRQWHVLDQVVGSIAALAQDVLVFVPKIVELDLVGRLGALLGVMSTTTEAQQHHIASLQYHVVNISRAIASYPFKEFHGYLTRVRIDDDAVAREEAVVPPSQSVTLMDRITKIAFDFTLELKRDTPASLAGADEQKTIGELATEILAMLRVHQPHNDHQLSRQRAAVQLPAVVSPAAASRLSSPQYQHVASGLSRARSPDPRAVFGPTEAESLGLPALSPHRHEAGDVSFRPDTTERAVVALPTTTQPVVLHGVDLLSTRPPSKPQPQPQPEEPHFIFARPKQHPHTTKSRRSSSSRDEREHWLMLDPLFQNTPPAQSQRKQQRSSSSNKSNSQTETCDRCTADDEGFAYSHELAHQGHQINLHARRNHAGDKYIPSLGQLQVADPTMNVLQRRE